MGHQSPVPEEIDPSDLPPTEDAAPPLPTFTRTPVTPRSEPSRGATLPYLPPPTSQPSRFAWLRRVPVGWLIVGLVFAGGSIYQSFTSADRDDTGAVVGAGDVASDELQGDCVLSPEKGEDGSFQFESLKAVPCSEPHDMEVFGRVPGPVGLYPGEDALFEFGYPKCEDSFESYVGLPVAHEARLIYSVAYPSTEGWSAGDRSLDCLLEAWGGEKLTGSQKGQGLLGFGGLEVGSCYDYTETDLYVFFTNLDCDEAHTLELYATDKFADVELAAFPGDEVIESTADDFSAEGFFAAFPGSTLPAVDFFWVGPDTDTWTHGDRLIQCFFFDPDGNPLVGSYSVSS